MNRPYGLLTRACSKAPLGEEEAWSMAMWRPCPPNNAYAMLTYAHNGLRYAPWPTLCSIAYAPQTIACAMLNGLRSSRPASGGHAPPPPSQCLR